MNKFFLNLLLIFFISLLASPIGLYWFGLSNIDGLNEPPNLELSESEILEVWLAAKETEKPNVKPLSPYSYFYMLATCKNDCTKQYPGSRLASLAVRSDVRSKLNKPRPLEWQLTLMAYSVWVTRNWTTEQIAASYKVAYDA